MSCKYGNVRCLCQSCIDNAAYPECKKGYCIHCFECEEAGKSVHDVFLCTGYERWPEEADKQAGARRGLAALLDGMKGQIGDGEDE